MGRKFKRAVEVKYGTALVRVRWPYLAFENLQVTVDYQGYKVLLQVEDINILPGPDTLKGKSTVQ